MKKLTAFMVCLLATITIATAHHYSNSISGKLIKRTSYNGLKVVFTTYKSDQLIENPIPVSTHTASINEQGEFSCSFNAPAMDFYLKMEIFENDLRVLDLLRTLTEERYYSQSGDSLFIVIRFDGKTARFSGRGSEKMNCQYLINETKLTRADHLVIGDTTLNHEPKSATQYRIYKGLLGSKEVILQTYKAALPTSVYQRITTDVLCRTKYDLLREVVPPNRKLVTSKMIKEGMEFLELHKNDRASLIAIDSNEIKSPYRCQLILNTAFILYENARRSNQTTLSYAAWMINYAKGFKGKLREDFAIAMVATRLRFYPDEFTDLMPEIFAGIKSSENTQILKTIVGTLNPTGTVIPFDFIDESGNKFSSADLKDKIVLMDFWFTGCKPCQSIPPIMKSIMERLKHLNDVIYLSISVDGTKKIWEQGLQSGKYTVPGQIHLFTGGGRDFHPFLKAYAIGAYPRIILLGKKGKILSFNLEPRNDNGNGIVRLIENEFKVEK